MIKLFVALLASTLLSGCAYTFAYELGPDDSYIGFRVYECKPLIAIQQSGLSVIFVPNPSKAYAVKFGTFLAKNDVEIAFNKDCGISNLKSNQDSTAAIQLLQDVVDKLAPDAVVPKQTGGGAGTTRVELYEIVFNDDGTIDRLKSILQRDLPTPAVDG